MKKHKNLFRAQRGQAVVLIALAIVGLLAMTALAVDSGNSYTDRRMAQGGSDGAALAGALARSKGENVTTAALFVTSRMGYSDSQVTVTNPPGPDCNGNTPNIVPVDPYDSVNYYIQVVIRTTVDTFFGPIVGVNQLNNCVSAIARGAPAVIVPPFNGNAVVGLDPNGDSFKAWSNAQSWKVYGGGVFANHNAQDPHNNVEFPDGDCVTAVAAVQGFNGACKHANQVEEKYKYPEDVISILPDPLPTCQGEAYYSNGKIYPDADAGRAATGSIWMEGFGSDYDLFFMPGLYCLPDMDGNIHNEVNGTNVSFYITDTDFTMKFNGGGELNELSAPTAGPYKGLLMFSNITPSPNTQEVDFRGNGNASITGTILMPSAHIDWRGNSTGDSYDSMIIGYDVSTNGNGTLEVRYNPEDNYKAPRPPEVELTR